MNANTLQNMKHPPNSVHVEYRDGQVNITEMAPTQRVGVVTCHTTLSIVNHSETWIERSVGVVRCGFCQRVSNLARRKFDPLLGRHAPEECIAHRRMSFVNRHLLKLKFTPWSGLFFSFESK